MSPRPASTMIRVVDGRIIVPAKVGAEMVGLTPGAVHNWHLTRAKGGGFYLDEIVKTRIEKLETKIGGEGENSLASARLRVELARAESLELDNEKKRGELVAVSDVSQALDRVFAITQQRILGVAPAVAPDLVGLEASEVEEALDDALRDALEELAGFDFSETDDEEGA